MNAITYTLSRASLSPCGKYRYSLTRRWNECSAPLVFIMLNPSTADAEIDDPTIRRCIRFAQDEGAGGIEVFNLFGLRTSHPQDLLSGDDPVGEHNDYCMGAALRLLKTQHPQLKVVCAWGGNARSWKERTEQVVRLLTDLCLNLYTINVLDDGTPGHPLYVKRNAMPRPWTPKLSVEVHHA